MSICYAFRLIDENNKPTGYYGIAVAENLYDMFFQIDEHGDPYSVEIKVMHRTSVCFKADLDKVSEEEIHIDFSKIELGESFGDLIIGLDEGFKKPKWPNFEERYKYLKGG